MVSAEKHGTRIDRISASKPTTNTTRIPTEIFLYIVEVHCFTPKLWSSVAIKVNSTHKCIPSRRMIELWFYRSSRFFLPFPIDFVGLEDLEVADIHILAYFFPHSHDIPYVCAPSLENVEISLHLDQLTTWVFAYSLMSPACVDLLFQPLRLFVGTNVNLQDITIPWAQLTHIMLPSELLTSTPIDLLRQCPRLMEWMLFRCGPLYDNSPQTLLPPFLPELHLWRIELEVHSMETPAASFDAIVLPALRTLAIKYDHFNNDEWPQSNFISLLSRSLCHLDSLALIGMRPSKEDFIRILQMTTPSLTALEIDTGFTGICLTDMTPALLATHSPLSDQELHECLAPNLIDRQGF